MADWTGTGEAYARSFAALTLGAVGPLLDEIDSRAAARGVLLDAGTGAGTVLAAAQERGWSVRGADAEASMVAVARRRHPGAQIDLEALPDLPYDDGAFAAATANFVLNHVPDPISAARELGRVVASGGPVAVTVWAGEHAALRPMWDAVLDRAGVARPPEEGRSAAGVPSTEAQLTAMLTQAGLRDASARAITWEVVLDPDALWLGVEGGIATIGGIYRAADASTRERLAEAYRRVTEEIAEAGGLGIPHTAILGSALAR